MPQNSPPRIAIVGAGLCGLANAIALSRAGYSVTVLERKSGLDEVGAGIQIQPNATRILYAWGLREAIEATAERTALLVVRRYDTGEVLRTLSLGDTAFEYPSWTIYRPDLQNLLYKAAIDYGAVVRFDAEVKRLDVGGPKLNLSDDTVIEADIVLLADGIGSHLREAVLGQSVKPQVLCGAYRVLIPREAMVNNEATRPIIESSDRQLWVGPHRNAVAYTLSRGRFYNLVLEHPGVGSVGKWNVEVDIRKVRDDFYDFAPELGQTLEVAADKCIDWTLARLPPLDRWATEDGRVVLVGDAAHATTPQLAQGAGMGFEDAAVLCECLVKPGERANIADAVARFVALRKPRVEKVQQASWDYAAAFSLPDGPEQELRDRKWRGIDQGSEGAGSKFLEWLLGHDVVEEARSVGVQST